MSSAHKEAIVQAEDAAYVTLSVTGQVISILLLLLGEAAERV